MSSLTKRLADHGKITLTAHKWLPQQVQYEVIMGSYAYGVSTHGSDKDIYGFAIPPKDIIFPHLAGEIPGFGTLSPRFEHFIQHHIKDDDGINVDMTIYSIVKYFDLCMGGNPNMVDSLFVPQNCILHTTQVGNMVRENRKIFLSKKSWHTFKGYAFSQLHKMNIKNPQPGSKRAEDIAKHGMDCKFGYHVVRLLDEVEMILTEGDLELGRNREHLKAIRRGEVAEEAIVEHFHAKEKVLEELYRKSTLPHKPNEPAIKALLLQCLEHHYGSLDECVRVVTPAESILAEIKAVLARY